ncbi:MAG TPA: hypothetical protein VGN72_16370 [Tepidisphaeraceae bacterium]|jgi:hypothetical protein|nr:hypothetical protein [Tepidisphaeraceae bacterium]
MPPLVQRLAVMLGWMFACTLTLWAMAAVVGANFVTLTPNDGPVGSVLGAMFAIVCLATWAVSFPVLFTFGLRGQLPGARRTGGEPRGFAVLQPKPAPESSAVDADRAGFASVDAGTRAPRDESED